MRKTWKKGLAFTLAASLAFGAAPVAGFGAPTVAEAAEGALSTASSVSLTLGKTDKTYQTFKADKLGALIGAKATATVGNKDIIGLALDADLKDKSDAAVTLAELKSGAKEDGTKWAEKVENLDASSNINIKALKPGSTTITLKADDGAATTQVIDISVTEATVSIKITDADDKEIKEGDTLNVVAGKSITAKIALDGAKTALADLGTKSDTTKTGYITDEKLVSVTYVTDTFTFTGKEEGVAEFSLYLKEDNKIVKLYINVIAESALTTTIENKTYKHNGTKWTLDGIDAPPTVFLNSEVTSAALVVSSNNGKPVEYSTVASAIVVDNNGNVSVRKDGSGKVTPGTYEVNVKTAANEKTGQAAIAAKINIVVSSKQANLAMIDVKGDGGVSIGKATVQITGPDAYANGSFTADPIKLSVKDKKIVELGYISNVSQEFVDVKSGDETIATVSATGTITAVKEGNVNITFTAKPATAFENYTATVTVPVIISAKAVNNAITASDIRLTETAPKATIQAAATYKNTLSFETLARPAKDSDPEAERKAGFHDYGTLGTEDQYDVSVNAATGEVTYKNNGKSGEIYVKVTGAANADSEAPLPAYVKVVYGKVEKKKSDLSVAKTAYEMKVGDSDTLTVTCSQKVTFSSDKASVATVSETGAITAVGEGTAIITVNALGDDTYESGMVTVRIDVSAVPEPEPEPQPTEKLANTMTAKGKTISTKAATLAKKAVKFTKAKAFKINNPQGSVTFTKKSGNAKVTITKAGKITVKKGLKKGNYKIKFKVKAAGNDSYKALTKTVTVTLKVK